MSLLWHELRKIWNLKFVGVVVLFCGLFFFALGVTDTLNLIRNPREVRPGTEHYLLADAPYNLREMLSQELLDWQRQFHMDVIESDCIYTFYEVALRQAFDEANAFIAQHPTFIAYGVSNITTRMDIWEQAEAAGASSEVHIQMSRALWSEESGYIGRKLDSVSVLGLNLRDFGEAHTRGIQASNLARDNWWELNDRQRQRITQILDAGEYQGLLPGCRFWGMTDLFRQITLILIMAALLLHSPLVTTDRARNMQHLQFHTRVGRRVVRRQFVSTIVSAVLLTTIVLLGLGLYLASTGVFAYWNQGITSYLTHFGPYSIAAGFWPISFGSYVLILVALCYGFSVGAAAVAFVISRYSRNMISLAIKTLPVFIVLAVLHDFLLPNRWTLEFVDRLTAPLTLWNHLYMRTGFAYLDIAIIVAFAGVAVLGAGVVALCDRRLELL